MTLRATVTATLALALVGSTLMPRLAHGVDVPVMYLAEEKPLRSDAPVGTVLTFELYADSSCTTMLHSEDVAIDNITISRLRTLKVKGAVKPSKAVELLYTLTDVAAPTANEYTAVEVVGPGVVGVDRSCQPQAAVLLVTTTSVSTSTTTSTTTSTSTTVTSTTVVSGCYIDTGLTVIDTCNNLEWEKKDTAVGSGADAGNLHDVDNYYSWAGFCSMATTKRCQPNLAAESACKAQTDMAYWGDGCAQCTAGEGTCTVFSPIPTTVWDWVHQVNTANFAGHDDWRLPSESGCNACFTDGAGGLYECTSCDDHELETILLSPYPCGTHPCIDSIFGPTVSGGYWSTFSSTPFSASEPYAYYVMFYDGEVYADSQITAVFVRAVRDSP